MPQYTDCDILTSGNVPKEVYQDMIRNIHQMEKVTNPLQKIRMNAGLRQKDLAEKLNRPTSYIGKIENGITNINNITMANGYVIAQALGCRMEDLVDKDRLDE